MKKTKGSLYRRLEKLEQKLESEQFEDIESIIEEWFNLIQHLFEDEEFFLDKIELQGYEAFKNNKEYRKGIKAVVAEYDRGENYR